MEDNQTEQKLGPNWKGIFVLIGFCVLGAIMIPAYNDYVMASNEGYSSAVEDTQSAQQSVVQKPVGHKPQSINRWVCKIKPAKTPKEVRGILGKPSNSWRDGPRLSTNMDKRFLYLEYFNLLEDPDTGELDHLVVRFDYGRTEMVFNSDGGLQRDPSLWRC